LFFVVAHWSGARTHVYSRLAAAEILGTDHVPYALDAAA